MDYIFSIYGIHLRTRILFVLVADQNVLGFGPFSAQLSRRRSEPGVSIKVLSFAHYSIPNVHLDKN